MHGHDDVRSSILRFSMSPFILNSNEAFDFLLGLVVVAFVESDMTSISASSLYLLRY